MRTIRFAVLLPLILGAGCASLQELRLNAIADFRRAIDSGTTGIPLPPGARLDTVAVDSASSRIVIRFNRQFGIDPFRPATVSSLYRQITPYFTDRFEGFHLSVQVRDTPIEELVPNYYRGKSIPIDSTRLPRPGTPPATPVVRNISSPVHPTEGLTGRNIALWHSHGWYYAVKEGRWEWQRPRLFQTVEDMVPMSFTLPYLIPMLEKAGASVYVPRERDTQKNEVVVDNDAPGDSYLENALRNRAGWKRGIGPGFAAGTPPYPVNHNPFLDGTSRETMADTIPSATISWTPLIPEGGEYGVYISYAASPENVPDAHYSVYHAGGRTDFLVNQQAGGGTWIFLGRFTFAKGKNPGIGRVTLTNVSGTPGRRVTGDAIRFGGGMGLIERNGQTSGKPKFLEGARYFLQYAGMPDTLVYDMNGSLNDYNDDYVSRSEFANYLTGAPNGPNRNRSHPGLGIPIDLTLAFHTDAGITRNDTVVGTLSIFSTEDAQSSRTFPDGLSRMANRDFADILQTQIVDDLRVLFDPAWRRRQLMDSKYSEAYRGNMPGALLELLSHQNFLDMTFMLDPRFRFHVARSIYKAMLRFISFQHGSPYTVQPLPPRAFSCELQGDGALLGWAPTDDPLEPGAAPARYILYTRIGEGGFNNGEVVEGTSVLVPTLKEGVLYSFMVAGVNAGGEGFPSEILSTCRTSEPLPVVLIVNGFDRIAGPRKIETSSFAGFLSQLDAGVPDRTQLNLAGMQHDFDPASPWVTNDAPGHGASYADREGEVIAGNSFDFPACHGRALLANGYSFTSTSREAVMNGTIDLARYRVVDLILGEEKETLWPKREKDPPGLLPFAAFPKELCSTLAGYLGSGGRLFLSGSYIASDPAGAVRRDSSGFLFTREWLRYGLSTANAARGGAVISVHREFLPGERFTAFQVEGDGTTYGVEAPDALLPVGGSALLLRYAENGFGAATGYRGDYRVVAFGFPFEGIPQPGDRSSVMGGVMGYLLGP